MLLRTAVFLIPAIAGCCLFLVLKVVADETNAFAGLVEFRVSKHRSQRCIVADDSSLIRKLSN